MRLDAPLGDICTDVSQVKIIGDEANQLVPMHLNIYDTLPDRESGQRAKTSLLGGKTAQICDNSGR